MTTSAHNKKDERYCYFCVNRDVAIDYKNTEVLKRFVSSFGKIVASKRSGLCAKHQRQISTEIKRARIIALLPFVLT
ncbi:MAG: 30S ribosomal protein S18 [Patescibacteria group bacterium]|jgi:small subunit ribosomal protein S18